MHVLSSADDAARWATEREGSPRSEVNCTVTHCIYENLWYNNGRFYLLVDGPHPVVRAYEYFQHDEEQLTLL